MSKNLTVSISFAEEDSEFAEKIVHGLLDKGFRIKCSSNILHNKVPNWGKHLLDIVNEHFSDEVDYCLVLITKNYLKSKWNRYTKCSLLDQAYVRKNFILPVKIGKNIPSLPGLALIDYLNVEEDGFQFIIDSFIAKTEINKIERDIVKGYTDIEDILKIKEPNAEWVRLSNENNIDKEKGIGFDLYANTDPILERVQSYVLYLYENSTIKNTVDYINNNHPYIFSNKNLIVLIPYEKNQIDYEKRKNHIKAAFRDNVVLYIKEFIWQYCTPKDFRQIKNEISIDNFVTPNIQIYNNETKTLDDSIIQADKFFIKWQREDDKPILVIQGTGGIGKTTLAQWITNYVEQFIPNTRAIFINSVEITSHLKRSLEISNELDLYKFYEADFEDQQSKNKDVANKLGKKEFKYNLDNGNIILVIDGFEEIITHLHSYFDINSFLSSIHSLSSSIGKGKVVITTRNQFWDKHAIHHEFNYDSIEVCPFNYPLTYEYFSTYFNKNLKSIEKSFRIARALMLSDNDNYIPFILDLVKYIVENRLENNEIKDSTFDAEDQDLLIRDINNDYLLFKICGREIIKFDKILSINEQINFFIRLATIYNGKIKNHQLSTEIKGLHINATSQTLNTIKAHPILTYSIETSELMFKYDLFDEHFKNIYLGTLINGKQEINSQLITILSDHNNYNSTFIDNLLFRLGKIDDGKKIIIISILDSIKNYKINDRDITLEIKNRAVSALFMVALKANHKIKPNNIIHNTDLLKELFSSDKHIDGFSIINCTSLTSPKIIFDFSSLIFDKSVFKGYEYFVDCKIDNDTIFYDSTFENLELDIIKPNFFKPQNLVRPKGNVNFKEYFKVSGQEKFNTKKDIIKDFESFLALFNKGGKIFNLRMPKLREKYHPKIVPFDILLKNLEDHKIVFQYNSPNGREEKCDIYPDSKSQVIKFLNNGANSLMIETALSELIELYK